MSVKVEEDAFEVGFIKDFLALRGAKEQGGATNIVDVTRPAFGVLKEASNETVAEELTLITGHAQMMFDVGGGFLKVERGKLITNGETLVEGEVRGEGEFVSQVGLAQEDEGELGGRVEILIEQETELVEDVRGQLVSLIEDEEEEAAFAGQIE